MDMLLIYNGKSERHRMCAMPRCGEFIAVYSQNGTTHDILRVEKIIYHSIRLLENDLSPMPTNPTIVCSVISENVRLSHDSYVNL